MTNYSTGYVENSHTFDYTFLNPFYKYDNHFLGTRYGGAQFIFIICAIINMILPLFILPKDYYGVLKYYYVFFIIMSFFLYYNISCYIIPNNHERCYVWGVWLSLLVIIFQTCVSLFSVMLYKDVSKQLDSFSFLNMFKNSKVKISTTTNKKEEDKNEDKKDEDKKDEDKKEEDKKDDEQTGGSNCHRKDDEQTGGYFYI